MSEREPIGVIGTGYVGLVTAAGFAELGSDVWCIDIDEAKIEGLKRGVIPIWEPGLEELVAKHEGRLHFSTNLADALEHARLLFVAVGTPPLYSGDADLSAVHAVVDSMPPSDRHALVMKSTVPVGTGGAIKRKFIESGKEGFRYVSCPEFLKEGSALDDFLHPDRVVIGDDGDWAGEAVEALYAPLGAPIVRTDIPSAEMVKLAANAFLATKISFINEIANVCEVTGADVTEVARGIGLDDRIGPKFLQAGIGFGGSCLVGEETVLARRAGRTTIIRLDDLYRHFDADEELEVMAWRPGMPTPEFLPVMGVSRRPADEVVEVRTKMGRRVVCTPDHPFVVSESGEGGDEQVKLARDLGPGDWLPLAIGPGHRPTEQDEFELYALAGLELAGLTHSDLIVQPAAQHLAGLFTDGADSRRTLRFDDAVALRVPLAGATVAPAPRGKHVPLWLDTNEVFWRIVGLYIAEGHVMRDPAGHLVRVGWTFNLDKEQHLVDEVVGFWATHGVEARAYRTPTGHLVLVYSRLIAEWWTRWLGLGRTSYEQRLPDIVWELSENCQRALLSGLWEGDGSWSLINGGPSVILEFGTISRELADGMLRLLGQLGIVASQRIGRTAKSTADTYWLRVAGAEQIERALFLVPYRDRPGVLASIARQSKRIAPTGYRKRGNAAWVRVTDVRAAQANDVYSLEVCGAHTFVATGGVAVHNCFPKDVSALKQLAGNSGYHFQLLASVLEVNDLQKRKVIQKLQKHVGTLVGKRIALLGLAFKPNTDDMRDASSLVLSARLQGEGALVSVYDPVAEEEAREMIHGVEFASDALSCVRDADAVVLVTEWQEFKDLDWRQVAEAMSGRLVVDGRNALDPEAIRGAGLEYEGIGRQSRVSLPVG